MQSSTAHRLIWGLLITVAGVVFLLNQVGLITMDLGDLIRDYWPVLLIVFGLQGLVLQHQGGFWWNGIMILIGCYFLGRNLGFLHWDFSDFIRILIPVAVILFGLSMIFKGNRKYGDKKADSRDGWNPVSPAEPPVPPVPPSPPPAPPELDEFEKRHAINLSKKESEERPPWSHPPRPDAPFREDVPPPPRQDGRGDWKNHRHDWKSHREDWKNHREEWKNHRNHHSEWWDHSCRNSHSRFIGDTHFGQDYWELKPMNISHFIGDTTLDLTKAQIPLGETKVYVSSFIGDVKVFVPNDLSIGIQVVSSCLIGDVKVLDQKRGGMFNQMTVETPHFPDIDKRVVLVVSCFIGDVRVTKVG